MEEHIRQIKVLEKERLAEKPEANHQNKEGVRCPQCGTMNESGVAFCENCGAMIGSSVCPYCGADMMPKTDYCEVCHRYVKDHVCSFCGGSMSSDDYFCSECGAPREGIVCPVCHTRNHFSFCSNCGTPLTESATQEQEAFRQSPLYEEMARLSKEFERLQYVLPAGSEEEQERLQKCEDIRNRLLKLLNRHSSLEKRVEEDADHTAGDQTHNLTAEELEKLIAKKRAELQAILDQTAVEVQASPAVSRRYAMARKPAVSKLGWLCNFKHEVHCSPQECACPQMGGKWIVLEGKQKTELKNR